MAPSSDKSNNEKGSNKKLVRILVIIGIGIPVIVELLTLFNLVNVRFFEEKDKAESSQQVEVRKFSQGDTLFSETAVPLVIDDLSMKVNPQKWNFKLTLSTIDELEGQGFKLRVDSLKLSNEDILRDSKGWEAEGKGKLNQTLEWDLPSGEIAKILYTTFQTSSPSQEDMSKITKEIHLGNLPVRYTSDK